MSNNWTSGLLLTWIKGLSGRRSRLMVWRLQGRRTCLCCGTWYGGGLNPPRQSGSRERLIRMQELNLMLTTIYVKSTISINSRQLLSDFSVSIVLIFCEPPNICLCRFYITYYHSKCAYEAEAVFEIRKTSSWINLPTVCWHKVLSAPIERGCYNAHTHITFTCIQHIIVNGKTCQKGVGAAKFCTSYQ